MNKIQTWRSAFEQPFAASMDAGSHQGQKALAWIINTQRAGMVCGREGRDRQSMFHSTHAPREQLNITPLLYHIS